jgi:hypothetical protein
VLQQATLVCLAARAGAARMPLPHAKVQKGSQRRPAQALTRKSSAQGFARGCRTACGNGAAGGRVPQV